VAFAQRAVAPDRNQLLCASRPQPGEQFGRVLSR
jgi:hypothetical protein